MSEREDLELTRELPGARVLFTTRASGDLSMRAGHEGGLAAREALCGGLGLEALCASRQVHGVEVERVSQPRSGALPAQIDADGHASALAGLGMMVLTGDCLPVALASRGAVAMVHAGWRGLAGGVLEEGVRAVRELGGELAIHAFIGPGAGACCYTVGPAVHRALGSPRRAAAGIDLAGIARERLLAAGVAQVGEVGACTICDPRFFSHRREGPDAGRQAGIAWRS